MAKSLKKHKARELRSSGKSIKQISQILNVSKSSVSVWCRDIRLNPKQVKNLYDRMVLLSHAGRIKGAEKNRQKKIDRILFWEEDARKEIGPVSKRDLLIAGIALYLGEGSKKEYFQFTNSSAALVLLCLRWLKLFDIEPEQLSARLFVNQSHRDRMYSIEDHWHRVSGIPKTNFTKPHFIKAKSKKQYESRDTYFGVIAIRAYKGSELFYRVLGLMKAFLYNTEHSLPA
jgi:hypothetical protein